jgi:succinate-semialdehyde dehydrogenase/glutarate-semialdehyde dehydrogenase
MTLRSINPTNAEPIRDYPEASPEEMRMRAHRMGDPLEATTDIGPQARRDLRDELHRRVQASLDRGARLRLGGEVPDGPGAFYPPSVLVDVGPGIPAYEEKLFGPVAAVIIARDEADALRIANEA